MNGVKKSEVVKKNYGYDIMDEIINPVGSIERGHGEWKWECSDDVKKTLENLGLFEEMETQMRVIHHAGTKNAIDVATRKLDALNKTISILKIANAVYKDSSAQEDEEGIDSVEILLKRDE